MWDGYGGLGPELVEMGGSMYSENQRLVVNPFLADHCRFAIKGDESADIVLEEHEVSDLVEELSAWLRRGRRIPRDLRRLRPMARDWADRIAELVDIDWTIELEDGAVLLDSAQIVMAWQGGGPLPSTGVPGGLTSNQFEDLHDVWRGTVGELQSRASMAFDEHGSDTRIDVLIHRSQSGFSLRRLWQYGFAHWPPGAGLTIRSQPVCADSLRHPEPPYVLVVEDAGAAAVWSIAIAPVVLTDGPSDEPRLRLEPIADLPATMID